MDKKDETINKSNPDHKMTLEEARNVIWFRTNPKPIGALLDEGFLNQSDLIWAEQNAYVLKIRDAATIILESLKESQAQPGNKASTGAKRIESPAPPITLDITSEEARNSKWPFSPYKGQFIGDLLSTGKIKLKDLAYAVDHAYERSLKQAATSLILDLLCQKYNEPEHSAGPLRIISGGRSFSEWKQHQLAVIKGMVLGGIFGVILAFYFGIAIPHIFFSNSPHHYLPLFTFLKVIGIAILVVVLGMWLLSRILDFIIGRLQKSIDKYRKGQEGEDNVVDSMLLTLDGNWSLFRNVSLPGRNKSDLDLVLVGPPGIWVLEVKNFDGEFKNVGEDWKYRAGSQWRPLKKSPSRQAEDNALRLHNFLEKDGIKLFVKAVVVWVAKEPLIIKNPTVSVWEHDHLPDELGNIWQKEVLSKDIQERIENKLRDLCLHS